MRWLLLAVAILAGLTWAALTAPRVIHYREQAENQGRQEASHRREIQRLRTVGRTELGADESVKEEAERALHHARLKDQYRWLATHPWAEPAPDLPLPYPWDRERDRLVLEAALADLMNPENPDNAIDFRFPGGAPCPEIVVGETTYPYLTDSRSNEASAAWNDLLRRNSGGAVLIAGIGLGGNRRVRYDDPDRLVEASVDAEMSFRDYFQKRYPLASGYVWVTLPGYSRDGRKATVFLTGGFSEHGESWAYEMDRTDTGWEVRDRGHHRGE
jgi:hypothetical protein